MSKLSIPMRRFFIIPFLAFAALSTASLRAVDLSAFVKETQMVDQSPGKMTMIWWTPKSYWKAALSESSQLTDEAKENIAAIFEKRLVVVIIRMNIFPMGAFTKSEEDPSGDAIACSYNGKRLKRIDPSDIDPDTTALLTSMKPGLAQALGQLGQGMEFYFFENPVFEKKVLVENTEGKIEFSAFGKNARFRLPLAAMLTPKTDLKTGDVFPGNFKFNPYTGERL